MPAVIEQPGKGPLYCPAPRHDVKPVAVVSGHLQGNFMRGLPFSHPLRQPLCLRAAIKAHFPGAGGGLDALTIDTPRGRLPVPALATALKLAQRLHELGPHARLPPPLAIPIDGRPLANLPRQPPPLTAGREQIPNPIKPLASVVRRTSGTTGLPLPGG